MSLLELFLFFFKISAVTFGGGIVILGMVQLEEEKRRDIAPEVFADMVSLAASMPGPIAVSIAWLAGTSAIIVLVIIDNVKNALLGKWWNLVPYLMVISLIGVFDLHPLLIMVVVIAMQFVHERVTAR